jgi:ParB-like nuclease domain
MSTLTQLHQRLSKLIELGSPADRAALDKGEAGRRYNPLYSEDAVTLKGVHRIGIGVIQSIPLSKVISSQMTVHDSKVRSIKGKILRGTLESAGLPTVQAVSGRYVVHDGNHRLAAALLAGKRMVRARVQ